MLSGSQVEENQRHLLLALLANHYSLATIGSELTHKYDHDTLLLGNGFTQETNHSLLFGFGLTQKSFLPSHTVSVGLAQNS
jgi:hypothetical protein